MSMNWKEQADFWSNVSSDQKEQEGLEELLDRLEAETGPVDPELLERARKLFERGP